MKLCCWISILALIACVGQARAAGRTITLETLLREMVDRDAAARLPDPQYTCRQASSYDRRSKTPDDPDGWFANDDWSQFIRSENNQGRREWVMLDADGPGCVVRVWWGGMYPRNGKVRFYLDGSDRPAIEAPAYDLLVGNVLAGRPLAIENAKGIPGAPGGMNLFLPIPYSKHCKITWDGSYYPETKDDADRRWYNIEYRTYPAGTRVETFSMAALEAARPTMQQVQETLLNPADFNSDSVVSSDTAVDPGKAISVGLPQGPAALRLLQVQIHVDDAGQVEQALRSTILIIRFDGEETVRCPVSDFFGSGIGVNPLLSWYRAVDQDGLMTCRWVMPYHKTADIQLLNEGRQPVTAQVKAVTGSWKWDRRSMHFHANWRYQQQIPTRPRSDWNYITVSGKGVYAGDTLVVYNPVPDWWGEGDEKIYVDGEAFPSHFGTGSEDYYGYSWGNTTLFQGPFSNQVRCDGPGNKGYTVVTRTRCLDAIPFTRSLRFDMEIWHWADVKVDYAATTYWYALPGAIAKSKDEG